MSHQVKSWYGSSVASVASHPAVRALATRWLQIRAERDPCLSDFWHNADETLVDSSILFIKGDADYTYLHHGRTLRERIGFSMQGLNLSDLRTRVRAQLMEIYDRCADEFSLAYFQSFADFQQEVMLWGRICLPLRISPGDPRLLVLLYCHPIEDKASIFKTLFERSHAGTIIAAPIRDEAGRIADAWVIAQNDEASAMTGIMDHRSGDLLLRSIDIFSKVDLWIHLTQGSERGVALACVNDPERELSINIHAELIDDYLVLRLTRVSRSDDVFIVD